MDTPECSPAVRYPTTTTTTTTRASYVQYTTAAIPREKLIEIEKVSCIKSTYTHTHTPKYPRVIRFRMRGGGEERGGGRCKGLHELKTKQGSAPHPLLRRGVSTDMYENTTTPGYNTVFEH